MERKGKYRRTRTKKSADKDVRTEEIKRAKEKERERERQRRTKRRNGVREKKGSNSFSFSSLIRLVNRLFWRSRRSHNRATSLLGFRGEEANGNTATIDARRLVCSRRPVLQGAFFLIAPHGYPTCVLHSREIAPAILSVFFRPALFALSLFFSLWTFFGNACEGKRLQDGGSGCEHGRAGCLWIIWNDIQFSLCCQLPFVLSILYSFVQGKEKWSEI